MKRFLICIATLVAASGGLRASSVISCGILNTSPNPCSSAHLGTFNLQVDWNSLTATNPSDQPTIDGNSYNTTWDASAGYVNVQVSGTGLIRADNYAMVQVGSNWMNPTGQAGFPYRFTGTFDSPPDTSYTVSNLTVPVGTYGETLLGSKNAGTFVIGTTNAILNSFGFRVASVTNANFDVTIQLFSSTDGSGTPLETLSLASLTGGGNCPSLSNSPPQPCNTAPFLFVSTSGGIRSFAVTTNDGTGFYMSGLDVYATPEPATMVITGAGLIALAFAIRRKRSATARS